MRRDFPRYRVRGVVDRLETLTLAAAERQSPERIQAAIVLLAAGDVARLEQAAVLAETDWRDVLVAAGLADADWPSRLDHELGGR